MQLGLRVLIKLQARAAMRQVIWGIKTPNGALFFGLGAIACGLWLLLLLVPSLSSEQTNPELVCAVAPLALLVVCVLSTLAAVVGQTALFSPSEIDFLFPAPFSRRELVAYKIVRGILAAVPVACVCTVLSHRHVGSWLAGLTGFVLGLVFVQLVSMALLLIGQIIYRRARPATKYLALLALVALFTWLVAERAFGQPQTDPLELVHRLRHSWGGYLVLSVFDVFGRTVSARALYPDLTAWAILALGIDAGLVALIIRLDASYADLAWQSGTVLKTVGRSGGAHAGNSSGQHGLMNIAAFPWLGGAGPIAWRQLIGAMRAGRRLIWLLLIMIGSVGPILLVAAIQGRLIGSRTAGIVWLLVFVPALFRFDFRSDLKHMDWLKSLPVTPTAVALGEIAPPVLLTTLVQVVLLAGLSVLLNWSWNSLMLATLFALPVNAVSFSLENLLFLLFPGRLVGASPGSIQYLGRQLTLFMVKAVLLVPCALLALCAAGLAFKLASESWPAFYLAFWCTLMLQVAALVPCVGWAFRRCDVTVKQ